jgi:hypothetical protein
VLCKLGYNIAWDKSILDRPCDVCGETDCEGSRMFTGWDDDDEVSGFPIICATEAGPPPDDWKPEEAKHERV